MSDSVVRTNIEFPSHDNTSTIRGVVWQSEGHRPIGIVQLIHGMAEHIKRYDAFACFLVAHGYLVCGHDHIGHGHSVSDRAQLGHLPLHDGADILIEDVETMRMAIADAFPDIPFFMFGHSMGSFVLRVYLTRYGEGLSGAVACATGYQPPLLSAAGGALAKALAKIHGEAARKEFMHDMVEGRFARMVKDPRTSVDWVSANEDNVDAYLADDLNGFPFSLGGYATLLHLTELAANAQLAKRIPHDLPVLFIAGADDPVGAKGRGVQAAADLTYRAGVQNVEVILYEGMRHEILNEKDSDRVFHDVLHWLTEQQA